MTPQELRRIVKINKNMPISVLAQLIRIKTETSPKTKTQSSN